MMNVAIPSHSSILEANILEFAINDDPDFLEEFEDDDSMPGLLEKTPHLASWYYTQTMMTLVKPPLCLNCWTDLKIVRLMMTQMTNQSRIYMLPSMESGISRG
jgi:hypothetical protein